MKQEIKLQRILLIDDDPTSNFLTQTILEYMDLAGEVVVVEDGEQALAFVQTHCLSKDHPTCASLILLDLNMPHMNGIELLETLQEKGHLAQLASRIIALTTSTHPKDLDKLKQLGVNQVLNKPITEEKLKSILSLF